MKTLNMLSTKRKVCNVPHRNSDCIPVECRTAPHTYPPARFIH